MTRNPASDESAMALAEEGREVRDFIASNRSDALLRLFDFLLEQSIQGRRPRETEIAEEIFPGFAAASGSQGSQVRVAIHRLRKKLDLYYQDRPGKRLVIPQGDYGFRLKYPEAAGATSDAVVPGRASVTRTVAAAVVALLLANAALAWFHFRAGVRSVDISARPALWQPFFSTKSPILIAIGDYFMFIRKGGDQEPEEVIQDLSIDSSDAFYEYVTKTAGMRGATRNEDLYAVSSEIIGSISPLWSYLTGARLRAVASSALDPDMMKSSSIVYVGALDALSPLLKDPLFQASQFTCAATCYALIDTVSGRQFLSDSPYLLGDRIVPRRDYGYVASFPGPSGNPILIVSGTGDAAVTQMAGIVVDGAKLDELRQRVGGSLKSFEALYQVRTMFSQSYGSSLLMARPINTERIWERSAGGGSP